MNFDLFKLELVHDFNKHGLKYRLYDLDALQEKQNSMPDEPCPMFIQPHHKRKRRKRAAIDDSNHANGSHHDDDGMHLIPRDELYHRRPFIDFFDYYPSYIIWTENYKQLFSIFDSTILQCKQKVDVGIYDSDAYFYFIVGRDARPEAVFEYNDLLKRHPHVAILQQVDTLDPQAIKYKIYGYNFFDEVNNLGKAIINHVWAKDRMIKSIKQAFTSLKDMQGWFTLIIELSY